MSDIDSANVSGRFVLAGSEEHFNIVMSLTLRSDYFPLILDNPDFDGGYYKDQVEYSVVYEPDDEGGDNYVVFVTAFQRVNPEYDRACRELLGGELSTLLNPRDADYSEAFMSFLQSGKETAIKSKYARGVLERLLGSVDS